MLLKLIAFLVAAMPVILLVRSLFFKRSTRLSEGMREFRRQVDIAVWILLGLIGCVIAFGVAKLIWNWSMPL